MYLLSFSGTDSLALALTAGIVAVASLIIYQLVLHPLARYPGPFLAKFTNFWRLASFLQGTQHSVDAALHRRYGSIVRDGPNSLLIADIDIYRTIYGFNKPEVIKKGDFYRLMWNKDREYPNLFAASTEKQHRYARRAIASTAVSPRHVAQYAEAVGKCVETYIAILEREILGARTGKITAIDIVPGIECLTFDAIISVAYGSSMSLLIGGRDTHGILAAKETVFLISAVAGHIPWLSRLLSTKRISAFIQRPRRDAQGAFTGISAVAQWVAEIWQKAKNEPASLSPCILKNLLTVEDGDSRKLDDEHIRFECLNAMFAGTGSTTAGLTAIFYELARHPEVQTRILRDPTDGKVLNAVIKESLRIHAPFAAPFERIVMQKHETVLNVPAGTRVWSNGYIIARDKSVYGADAEDWRPERWLDGPTKDMDDVFPVFGRGSRGCIGKDLTWIIMQETVKAVLVRWELGCNEREGLRGKNAFEMRYKHVNVTFTPRMH